jgi:hypothetical protein
MVLHIELVECDRDARYGACHKRGLDCRSGTHAHWAARRGVERRAPRRPGSANAASTHGTGGVPPSAVEDVIMGCVNQAGEDNRDIAHMALLLAGFPVEVAGTTVNRLCGSGLDAVAVAARALLLGEAHVYIGAGVESMSRAPWAVPKTERAFATGHVTAYDTTLGWRFVNPRCARCRSSGGHRPDQPRGAGSVRPWQPPEGHCRDRCRPL